MSNKEKQLLFSLTAKDFEWEYFCTGGPGGQNQNRRKNGVRCTHRASGASAEGRDSKSQSDNKSNAFTRCCQSEKFKSWHKGECARRLGLPNPELLADKYVEQQFADMKNFKIEVQTGKNEWQEISWEDFILLS